MPLANISAVKNELRVETTTAAKDAIVLQALEAATARIHSRIECEGLPRIATFSLNHELRFKAGGYWVIPLPAPLLSASAITDVSGNALTASTDYMLEPAYVYPRQQIKLNVGVQYMPLSLGESMTVTGTWGYHSDYPHAWETVGALSAAIASATATTLTTSAAVYAGDLLQIGSEWLEVTLTSGTTVTVKRGARGSTASTHDNGTVIAVWRTDELLHRAAVRYAAYLVSRIGAFEQTTFDGVQAVSFPSDMPADIAAVIGGVQFKTPNIFG